MKILFIGNSHTYYNDMPHIFADTCRGGRHASEAGSLPAAAIITSQMCQMHLLPYLSR